MRQSLHLKLPQAGIVLVSSLLLLLVVTIMALSIFRSFGIQEKIAGNTREKQRALQGAMSAQQFAESWLANISNAPTAVNAGVAVSADIVCGTTLLDANTGGGQICSNTLASLGITVTSVSTWTAGVMYYPPGMNYGSITNSAVPDIYYDRPRFYITDLGPLATNNGEVYKVDAYSYGTSANTVAVVESTFAITCIVCNPGGI
jgi:type IV pilus assembly protein PilX